MALSKKAAVVNRKNCVACGTCVKECPKNALHIYKGCYAEVNTELCIGCGKCIKVCPTGCIATEERGKRHE